MAEKNIESYIVANDIVIEKPRAPIHTAVDDSVSIRNPFRATSVHQGYHLPDRPITSTSSLGPVQFSASDIGQSNRKTRRRTVSAYGYH